MTARPIRRNAQTPDRNGKIFYTSTTSLSHISKMLGFVALPASYFAYLIPAILLYMILATSLKKAYVRHYGELL